LRDLTEQQTARDKFLSELGESAEKLDLTDGLRMFLRGSKTLHLRLSGNAPELRIYVEAENGTLADGLLQATFAKLTAMIAT